MDYKRRTNDKKFSLNFQYAQTVMQLLCIISPAISFESVQSFIEGGDEPVPKLPDRLVGVKRYVILSVSVAVTLAFSLGALILQLSYHFFHRPVISEIFYLLADFYFKNKEFRYLSDFKYFSLPLDGFVVGCPEFNSSVRCKQQTGQSPTFNIFQSVPPIYLVPSICSVELNT